MPGSKRKTTRRSFLKKTAAILGGSALGLGAGELLHRRQARIAVKTAARNKRRAEAMISYRKAGIVNAGKWSRLSEVYNLDPVTNVSHRALINSVNRIAKFVGITPERVMYTFEENPVNKTRVWELQNKIINKKNMSTEETERTKRIIKVLQGTLQEQPNINNLIKATTAQHGSRQRLLKEFAHEFKGLNLG